MIPGVVASETGGAQTNVVLAKLGLQGCNIKKYSELERFWKSRPQRVKALYR